MIKISVLMEDTCGQAGCAYEHGFSVYIETEHHRVLADTGKSEKTVQNAQKMGIDLSRADTVVISHGHYDHAGGLLAFCDINSSAVIYMHRAALGDYYHGGRYIGIDKQIGRLANLRLTEGRLNIDKELSLFSDISGRRFWPQGNLVLSQKQEGQMIQDAFVHEQCLVVRESQTVLISGCAHNGILNILDKYNGEYGGYPDAVISGFHMMKKTGYTQQEKDIILRTAEELAATGIVFYTGHCTGQDAIGLMKPVLGERLVQLHCGDVFELQVPADGKKKG